MPSSGLFMKFMVTTLNPITSSLFHNVLKYNQIGTYNIGGKQKVHSNHNKKEAQNHKTLSWILNNNIMKKSASQNFSAISSLWQNVKQQLRDISTWENHNVPHSQIVVHN